MVETLARMAQFIVVDLTDPSSVPHELGVIVPYLRTTPVLPLRLRGSSGYTMIDDFKNAHHWVLDTYQYVNLGDLIQALPIITKEAQDLACELRKENPR